jgi:hypothetical protein
MRVLPGLILVPRRGVGFDANRILRAADLLLVPTPSATRFRQSVA